MSMSNPNPNTKGPSSVQFVLTSKLVTTFSCFCASEFNEPASWQSATVTFLRQREEVGADLWSGGWCFCRQTTWATPVMLQNLVKTSGVLVQSSILLVFIRVFFLTCWVILTGLLSWSWKKTTTEIFSHFPVDFQRSSVSHFVLDIV